jgi:hypothetical protein
MKLTKLKLQQIIKEELEKLNEISDKELGSVGPETSKVHLDRAYQKTIGAMQDASTFEEWIAAMYDGFIGTPTQENERRAKYNLEKLSVDHLKYILEGAANLLNRNDPGKTGGFAPAWTNFETAILKARPDLKSTLQSFENSMIKLDPTSWQR